MSSQVLSGMLRTDQKMQAFMKLRTNFMTLHTVLTASHQKAPLPGEVRNEARVK